MMFIKARQDQYGITQMQCEQCGSWSSQEFAPGCHDPDCGEYVSSVSVLRHGERPEESDGEYRLRWVCFDRQLVERYAAKFGYKIEDPDLIYALTGWHARDCHPGGWFWAHPWKKLSRTRFLIKQTGGLDI